MFKNLVPEFPWVTGTCRLIRPMNCSLKRKRPSLGLIALRVGWPVYDSAKQCAIYCICTQGTPTAWRFSQDIVEKFIVTKNTVKSTEEAAHYTEKCSGGSMVAHLTCVVAVPGSKTASPQPTENGVHRFLGELLGTEQYHGRNYERGRGKGAQNIENRNKI